MSAEAERKTENLPQWKEEEVDELVEMIESFESVGIVNVQGIPSRQLQAMRADLYPETKLRMSRNTLLKRALDDVDEGIEVLSEHVSGQVGFITTDDNPFALFKVLEASKTPAPISAGEVAPNDIVIPEGDTGVDPGPFVGELQQVGAAARIQDGSIHVTEDSKVLSAGEEVSDALANVLGELGIEPKEVGLDLRAVYSEGVVFDPEDLDIDVDAYRSDVATAAARGRNLSVNAVYPTTQTLPTLVAKATGEAKSLGLNAAVESPDLADDLVRKADGQVRALAAQFEDTEALPEELQDIEAPAATGKAETESEDVSTDDQDTTETEAADEDEDEGDDDEEEGAAGLGNMFG
ncbi:50S ribosomal protein L10 [Haloarchaeobius sp. HRN-SO-5]|uniref:50S ribosomal protein L10 n=1 Tax=Haloarchaeobius sp. HRN-SO-5 TaxID=3446118 RepID=UPI003EC14FBB